METKDLSKVYVRELGSLLMKRLLETIKVDPKMSA